MQRIKNTGFMKRMFLLPLLAVFAVFFADARTWTADVLGDGYLKTTVAMPDDYSGQVVSTVVKKRCETPSSKAVLYVHGYNDYFFQSEMGNRFVAHGYNFYAVDLRKYGRSILKHQRKFEVRNLNEYFADIDSALTIIQEEGNREVVLMGHSTGGLIAAYYMVEGDGTDRSISALVLNSPFLDMNLSDTQENYLLPVVSALSGMIPNVSISQNSNNAYAQSLLKKYHGEWNYNTDWKMELSPDVTTGWLGAIHKAQMKLQKGAEISVPILLMRSWKTVGGDEWTQEFNRGDCVLDVDEISMYGKRLGDSVQEVVVKDGLHDLILSRKPVRDALYVYIFDWLSKNVTSQK